MIAELLCVTTAVDAQPLVNAAGLSGLAGEYGPSGLRFIVLAIAFTLAFAGIGGRRLFASPAAGFVRTSYAAAAAIHFAAFAAFLFCCVRLCGPPGERGLADVLVILSVAAGLATIVSGSLVLVRASFWRALMAAVPGAPWYGMAVAAATVFGIRAVDSLGQPWMALTSAACYHVLRLLPLQLVYDPATFTLGTQRFSVIVSQQCSGLEGIALMMVFTGAWLICFRREFRFPQAVLMVPAGVVASWILNVVRIVALILIGNAGAERIAVQGFHSEAGWISFILLAISLVLVFQRWSWAAAQPRARESRDSALSTETAAYLVPFLAILAAGMAAQASSAGFEWLYPLRVMAAAAALLYYRPVLSKLNWRAGWLGAAVGAAVFVLWIGWDRMAGASGSMPAAAAAAPDLLRWTWIAFRVAGAVVTVPAAEELAFRGYLMRRLDRTAFAAAPFRSVSWFAVAASSVVFGLLHGRFWIPGMIAGVVYAVAARRRERIGEAVLAHAVTNGMLAIWVLYTGNWRLW